MVIYFLGSQDGLHFKIGKTTRKVASRMSEHAGRGPNKHLNQLTFLAAVPGIDSDETSVHRYFSSQLMEDEKEWFHTSPELEGYIRWLRMQWFTLRSVEEADTDPIARSHDCIDGSDWLPNSSRVVEDESRALTLIGLGDTWGHVLDVEPTITNDDFYTDKSIIDAARHVMGGIDLDPATHPVANRKFIRAPRIYTLTTNGLDREWGGRVWVNPPFGDWVRWGPKIAEEWRRGEVLTMCALMSTRTFTVKAIAPIYKTASAMCIMHGRIPFWGGKATESPNDGHAVFFFGENVDGFIETFSSLGHVALLEASGRFGLAATEESA